MLIIPRISTLKADKLQEAAEILKQTPAYPIACNNWKEKFPYTPEVSLQLAHNQQELFLHFKVREECTMAKVREDNGEVWTDSCVEFFLALDDSGYYNFEFTCIGKALLGFRKERPAAVHVSPAILSSIKRYSTLGTGNFGEKRLTCPWQLTVAIPATALFRHQLNAWEGVTVRVNAYKCGDHLSQPHYLSWFPINTPNPDFHIPRCFSEVQF